MVVTRGEEALARMAALIRNEALTRRGIPALLKINTFLRFEDVKPANNRAERALRPAVTKRKAAFGSTSEKGVRWTERILPCWQTCRIQGWSSFEFLRNAMANFLRRVPQDLSTCDALLQRTQEARAKLGLDDMSAPPTA